MSGGERFPSAEGRAKFRRVDGTSATESARSLSHGPLSSNNPQLSTSPAPHFLVTPDPSAATSRQTPIPQSVPPTTAKTPWAGLRRFQQALTTTSDVFNLGSLKLVMNDLAGLIEMHEDAASARRDYQALKTELEELFDTLSTHFGEGVPPTMTASMDNLCSAIKKELDQISAKKDRGAGKRHREAKKDLDEVLECYQRIQGHLNRLTLNADLSIWKIMDEQATEARLDKLKAAMSAYYNSAEAALVRRRECTPNTREQVLSDLSNWRHDKNQGNIFWLNGMAGTGKTTIANSLCRMLERTHELGASFFCTRQLPECRNVNRILPTIAYQLARFSRPFRFALSRALERDPDIHTRALPNQLEGLVVTPLREVARAIPTDLVVVIDALDECEDRDRVGDMLKMLIEHASDFPIKVFVASRPEPQIRQWSQLMKNQLVLHELDDKIVKDDIEIYLRAELEGISIPESQLANLVERAGVLFIYAATVVRYIRAKKTQWGQQERLNHVLNALPMTSARRNQEIDALYNFVLISAFSDSDLDDSDTNRMRLVLDTVVCAQEPLTVGALAGLLQLGEGGWVRDALEPLWSVLHVFESQVDSLVTTLHASFPDYMLDTQRSREHCCNATLHHGRLAELCLARIQNNERQFNVCDLESSYVLDEQVLGLEDRVNHTITLDLRYACQYWAVHLELGEPSSEHLKMLDEFLSMRLLLWMEVLNLGKRMSIGPALLDKARKWCTSLDGVPDTKDLVYDAWRFATTFAANPVSRSTPHLYVSMLASWPSSRPIAARYRRRTKQLVNVKGSAMERRELALLGVIAAGTEVRSVAFSPNGMRIVSGSDDRTVQVWDAQTGQMVLGPLKGHTAPVISLAFSPDGMRIVSASNTIRVWDARTGQLVLGPLEGHTESVCLVALSPDGMRIVSGSSDKTIRVWDAMTGQIVLGPLKGHTASVFSVAFSPDGMRIVSGSDDKTIRVWDTKTGQTILKPLEGHTWSVNLVAFSPDGMHIVSGSKDKTIRVWNAKTGNMVLEPLKGHTESINSLAFSPDGIRIVSCSSDKTIRVWDTQSGQLVLGPLKGHTRSIHSVAFSPDSMRIVSGSDDQTIRVWDAQTGQTILGPLEGHTGWVNSAVFSPDSMRIVSGSADKTIRLWNARTGQIVFRPLEGHTDSVRSTAFSPNGMRIVSSSSDKSIRMWDAHTGQMVLEPLVGHAFWVSSVAFSPDGLRVVSGSKDSTVRVWDANTGKMALEPLRGHRDSVSSVMFSPDGMRILSGSGDDTIRVWDANTGKVVLGPLEGHTALVFSVAFSPDGMYIVSGTDDYTIQVWDAKTGQMVLAPFQGHTDCVTSVAFSPDGMHIVSGSWDRTIRVWDAKTGQTVLGPLKGHTDCVNSVAYSPDGMHIVSGSKDNTIRVWQAPNSSTVPVSPSSPSWELRPDGWAVDGNQGLLLWVPHDLHDRLLVPPNTLLVSTRGSAQLGFEDAVMGRSWTECYQPS